MVEVIKPSPFHLNSRTFCYIGINAGKIESVLKKHLKTWLKEDLE